MNLLSIVSSSWKPLLAAATTITCSCCCGTMMMMDCNPQLYIYERFIYNPIQSYENKAIWIIGASSGIGETMAIQLSKCNCSCIILSGRNETKLLSIVNQCQQQEENQQQSSSSSSCIYHCIPMDVTDLENMQQVVQDIIHNNNNNDNNSIPPLDMVVLNAGAGQLSPAIETDPYVIEQIMQTNAIWPMILLPLLLLSNQQNDKKNPKNYNHDDDDTTTTFSSSSFPHILVTSSIAAKVPVPLSGPYAAAKAAVQQYFYTLITEVPNLRIDLVCPGPVDTPFHKNHIQRRHELQEKQSSTTTTTTMMTTTTTTEEEMTSSSSSSSSRLKMSVDRCVRLMLAAGAMGQLANKNNNNNNDDDDDDRRRRRGLYEHWIAKQPVLLGLYLNQLFPYWMRSIFQRIGMKRVQLWRNGYDLYDPKSWTKTTTATTTTKKKNKKG